MKKALFQATYCGLVLNFCTNPNQAWAQASYGTSSATSTVEFAIILAIIIGGLVILYKKGFFRQFRLFDPALGVQGADQPNQNLDIESAVELTLSLMRKSRLARNVTSGLVLFSIGILLLLLYKIHQTSAFALRYDDRVKEQLGYWGIGLAISWIITAIYGSLYVYGVRQISKRKNRQKNALIHRLSEMEIEIASAKGKETEGVLKSEKVMIENALRRLEAQ
jgi:hypothetical protein